MLPHPLKPTSTLASLLLIGCSSQTEDLNSRWICAQRCIKDHIKDKDKLGKNIKGPIQNERLIVQSLLHVDVQPPSQSSDF